jgi:hypothetical protein
MKSAWHNKSQANRSRPCPPSAAERPVQVFSDNRQTGDRQLVFDSRPLTTVLCHSKRGRAEQRASESKDLQLVGTNPHRTVIIIMINMGGGS